MLNRLLFVTLCIILKSFNAQKVDVLKVTVFYDAAEDDSKRFFLNQLDPAYKILGERLLLDLVPFALDEQIPGSGSWKPICVDNQDGCVANVIHTCAIRQTNDQSAQLAFVSCMFTADNNNSIANETIEACANSSSLPFEAITACALGGEGVTLLNDNGIRTRSVVPPVYALPTLQLNGFTGPQTRLREAFLQSVCACLNAPPEGCNTA